MIILVNDNILDKSKSKLQSYGNLVNLLTKDIVYAPISNHPDIFFCPIGNRLIVAPNLPNKYKSILLEQNISFMEGEKNLGLEYPETAYYNAVVTDNFIIGNTKNLDKTIIIHAEGRKTIHVNQAYTRCNLLPLPGDRFITSDLGILKQLEKNQLDVLYVNPDGILLEGFKNGFIGGCCGVLNDKVFIMGSIKHFPQGDKIGKYIKDMEIIELYDGPLVDIGSILFF